MGLRMSYDAPNKTYLVWNDEDPDSIAYPTAVTQADVLAELPEEQRHTYVGSFGPIIEGIAQRMALVRAPVAAAERVAERIAGTLVDGIDPPVVEVKAAPTGRVVRPVPKKVEVTDL